ncbi:MAG TPA: xanthine dehydrogenase family protein subunit M [Stellaceae bacterium]|nr:xanthine dehydrogenase family protein subunit M [Stellaceae bacterium]
MKPAAFEMHRPRTLAEALDMLDRHGEEARLIAGGQSLVPMMNLRIAAPPILIDLNSVAGLGGIRRDDDTVRIGTATRLQDLIDSEIVRAHASLLAMAARHTGHYSIRSRGTVGGNLCHADPASELVLAALTLRAEVTLRGKHGERVLPAQAFFRDALTTAIEPGEILTELKVPVAPAGAKAAFREHARRAGDFAIAAAAALRLPGSGGLHVALGAVTPVPIPCRRIEDSFRAGRLTGEIGALVAAELAGLEPIADIRSSASYRRKLASVCLADCVTEALA